MNRNARVTLHKSVVRCAHAYKNRLCLTTYKLKSIIVIKWLKDLIIVIYKTVLCSIITIALLKSVFEWNSSNKKN